MSAVLEMKQKIQMKSDELHEIYIKNKSDKIDDANGQPFFDMDAATLENVRTREQELKDLDGQLSKMRTQEAFVENQLRLQDLKGIERNVPHSAPSENRPTSRNPGDMSGQKLGDMVTGSTHYRLRSARKHFSFEMPGVDVKTLITTSAGFAPPNNRTNIVVDFPNRRPMVADLIPSDPTELSVIKWMENTTFTNAAASTAQGAVKPEAALVWTERSSNVEKIAVWIPVTEEQVDDVPGFAGIINRDLMLMLMLTEETQLLSGNGSTPQLDGFLHKSGVQTQAKGSDDTADAIFKAFTLVRWTGFAEPSGIIMHPNDWQDVRLLRTTDGLYIYGDPSIEGEQRLWGKPVIVTSAITENTTLTGDFTMYSHISRKMGIRVDVSDSHDVYFIYNKLAVRAEMRESLEIKRPSAFCTITGV